MDKFGVVEKFVSIDGEGPTAGALSVFIRFAGCNLRCAWCDTCYAQETSDASEELSAAEIVSYIASTGVRHVTLTGGEPLLQKGMMGLLARLDDYQIHIETNGSVLMLPFRLSDNIHFVVDYKLPGSGMEEMMNLNNFELVAKDDAVKFVIAGHDDFVRAIEIVRKYDLLYRSQVYFSTVFGSMQPAELVELMKEERLNGVKLQLQMHKYIWDKNLRGV